MDGYLVCFDYSRNRCVPARLYSTEEEALRVAMGMTQPGLARGVSVLTFRNGICEAVERVKKFASAATGTK